jgi:hypothetical protein
MSADDDKTRVGAAPALQSSGRGGGSALPAGFELREFVIERVIGEGGFSVVYLAHDRQLDRRVAIKEYMPSSLAARAADFSIQAKSENYLETFNAGLRSFVNEARLLAQFDHPSLVKVHRFWEERGTAYMVMPYYEGATLKTWIKAQRGPPDEAWVRRLLEALLEALEQLHARQCYHRDIAPDNILLLPGGQPLLLDFGAARRIIGDLTHALTVILKPGYAPVEQYAEVPSMRQGAWTDLYALAAVLYFVIGGRPPVPAVGRMMKDDLTPAAQIGAGRYTRALLNAIDAALAVKPEDRPQDIAAFRRLLGTAAPAEPTELRPAAPTVATTARPRRSRTAVVAAIAGAAIAIAAVGWAWLGKRAAPPAPAAIAMSPHQLLQRLYEARATGIEVSARPSATTLTIDRDELRFELSSSRAGYAYVLLAGTDDKHLWLLFPNANDADNRIAAGQSLLLPRASWRVLAGGPPGTNRVLAIVSPHPRDLSGAGLKREAAMAEFALATVAAAVGATGIQALAGRAVCEPAAASCDESFGAALFEVKEIEAPK